MGKKPVKLEDELHSALKAMQREFKKQAGVEPALGELVEKAFEEDPALSKVLEEERSKTEELWDDDEFMKL